MDNEYNYVTMNFFQWLEDGDDRPVIVFRNTLAIYTNLFNIFPLKIIFIIIVLCMFLLFYLLNILISVDG